MKYSSPDRDSSNGWEAIAGRLIAGRSGIGTAVLRSWCRTLPAGAAVLDLGCGAGVPVSETLLEERCELYAIDASPTLCAAYRRRFPTARVACAPVETADFFGRTYNGIVAVGLLFLLPAEVQPAVLGRAAAALNSHGRFLFTAPAQAVTWPDNLTGRPSISLGAEAYRRILSDAGLTVVGEYVDEGENHYYDAAVSQPSARPAR